MSPVLPRGAGARARVRASLVLPYESVIEAKVLALEARLKASLLDLARVGHDPSLELVDVAEPCRHDSSAVN